MKNYTFYLHQTKQKYLLGVFGFSEVLIIGFKNVEKFKDHLVRAVLAQLDRKGRSKLCEGINRACEVCESLKGTTKF